MRKAYQDPSLDYGFETETLSLMSFQMAQIMFHLENLNYKKAFHIIRVLYVSTRARIGKHLPEDFDKKVLKLNKDIYGSSGLSESVLYDNTLVVWGLLAEGLVKSDLMFRTKIDPSEIVLH